MHAPTTRTETTVAETERQTDTVEAPSTEWSTPDFAEQTACAEIGAYIFTA